MWSCAVMQPIAVVSTSDTGVMSSSRSGGEPRRPVVGAARTGTPGRRRAAGCAVVAVGLGDPARQQGDRLCRLWSRWYGGVRHVGEQDVGPLAQDGDHRCRSPIVDTRRESVPLPASAGTTPSSTRTPRRSTGTNSCKRGPSWRSCGPSATVSAGGVAFGRLTVRFKPGDTAYAGEQLNWMRAQFSTSRPGDRPAAREPPGRACAASKWARRIGCLCGEVSRAVVSGGAGGAGVRTRSP
jgi:hypothetical protein